MTDAIFFVIAKDCFNRASKEPLHPGSI